MLSGQEATSSNCSKPRKIRGGGRGGGEVDRISDLPDPLLAHILSFIQTKDAVRTHVLSKRWKYVWTSAYCIDIRDRCFLSRKYNWCRTPDGGSCFIDFVDRVLRLNDVPCLRRFHLTCIDFSDLSRLNDWIDMVTVRGTEELSLQYYGRPRDMELPPRVFTSEKLMTLKLYNSFVFNFPTPVCLPNLKILLLYHVQILDENSIEKFLAGCPVLEELDLRMDPMRCERRFPALYIRSSSLKSLILVTGDFLWHSKLVLDAENLARLHLNDGVTKQVDVISSLSSLVSVSLNLYPKQLTSEAEDIFTELLKKMICNTKNLHLYTKTMRGLENAPLHNLPMLRYLTHLKVELCDYSWHVLPYLLECSPNLITFDLNKELTCDKTGEVSFHMPKCMMLHLETISIHSVLWSPNEMEMVPYFLRNATVLKKISIYLSISNLKWLDRYDVNEVFTLPKASNACEIEILSKPEETQVSFLDL